MSTEDVKVEKSEEQRAGKKIRDFDVEIDSKLPAAVADLELPPHLAEKLEEIIRMVTPLGLRPKFVPSDTPSNVPGKD